ncbi:MAG: hypothetical protein M3256_10000 [Actinomycetota bacterium]|nr:hypothetical protein [Actinomycetota bacterium]
MTSALDKVANRQLGLITSEQLCRIGLTIRQVRRRVANGILFCMRDNVYRLAGAPISWEQAVLAAVLSAGHDAVASHATAAAVWNLRHSDRQRAGIHLTSGRQVRIAGVTAHRIRLSDGERTDSGCIPVTTPERTIIDLAGTLSPTQLGQCVDAAIRRRLVNLERLRRLVIHLAASGGRRRLLPVHHILAERIAGYRPDDSDFETEMNRLWDRLGLPSARRQFRIVVDGHAYRLDRAIVECKIGVEWDSYRYHSSPSDLDHDSNRRARLVGAGWVIIPVTAQSEPRLIAQAVLRAYHDRGAESA